MSKFKGDSKLVWSTETGDRGMTVLHAALESHYSRQARTVVHVDKRLHEPREDDPTGETLFFENWSMEVQAVSGETNLRAARFVAQLAPFTLHPFHDLVGIRILASEIEGYQSKIIFYRDLSEWEMRDRIERTLGYDCTKWDFIEPTKMSDREARDNRDWNLIAE